MHPCRRSYIQYLPLWLPGLPISTLLSVLLRGCFIYVDTCRRPANGVYTCLEHDAHLMRTRWNPLRNCTHSGFALSREGSHHASSHHRVVVTMNMDRPKYDVERRDRWLSMPKALGCYRWKKTFRFVSLTDASLCSWW